MIAIEDLRLAFALAFFFTSILGIWVYFRFRK